MTTSAHPRGRFLHGAAFVASLLVGFLLAGCEDGPPVNHYQLEGRVTDALTGDTLSGVRLTFTSDTLYTATAQSGDGGRYAMEVESDVRFGQVRAEKDGYLPTEQTVYFDRRERRLDFVLNPAP